MEQNIFTLHPNKRNGFCVDKHRYEVIRDYIISTLIRDGDVSLDDLLDEAKNEYKGGFDENVSWYVLIVKLDLEARGVIKCTMGIRPFHQQVIKLRRKKVKSLIDGGTMKFCN